MSQQEQYTKMSFTDFRSMVNLGSWISHLLAVFVNVFAHFGPGERYIGLPGLILIPVLSVYAGLTYKSGGAAVATLIPVYMLMCVIWTFWAKYRHKRLKIQIHTRYPGKPWILLIFPRWNETWVKKAEPLVLMPLGLAIGTVNHSLGALIFIAGLGQGMSLSIAMMIQHGKELDQMDSMLENRQLAASAREILKP